MRQSLLNGLKRPGGFVTPFGFSTEALDSPLYNGASYVKGPTWAPLNTLLFEALDEIGETGLAGKVRSAFCDTILAAGMSEHFDAKNGAPGGDPAYIWTAALFLLLATKEAQEGRMFS
jgi:glycogen debranching enzyme